MSELQKFSDGFAAAVEKAGQSVVTVDARGRFPATGVIWSADGEILTADHVVQRDENIKVTLPDGKEYSAALKGRDPASDLALLKIDAAGLALPGFAEAVKVGHLVFAVGRPDDLQATLGSVVAVGGPVRGRHRWLETYIQSDVTMYPGFSGGPLVDASGRVLGLNSSALARGASLAIPAAAARAVADALRRDGRVKRGFLGVSTQPVMLAEAVAARLNQPSGLMVIGLEKDGPAEKGGLMQGDVLVGVRGEAVADIEDLQNALGAETVGKLVTVKVVRGGEVKEISVTVGERP
ncbi:MAG TPA: trypsin-like peptidase domain-containing protein [Anaerolineales bacterium]|nr:trypsin-like peptidase domain-containing protein [Anaerolineales bacterium]